MNKRKSTRAWPIVGVMCLCILSLAYANPAIEDDADVPSMDNDVQHEDQEPLTFTEYDDSELLQSRYPQQCSATSGCKAVEAQGWINGRIKTFYFQGNYRTKGKYYNSLTMCSRTHPQVWSKGNKLYVYGGGAHTGRKHMQLADMWVGDMKTNKWAWLSGPKPRETIKARVGQLNTFHKDNNPGGVRGAGTWRIGDSLYLMNLNDGRQSAR